MSNSTAASAWIRDPYRRRDLIIWGLAAGSAVAAMVSPARPVGLRAADAVWCALFGAVVPLIASRSRRMPLLWAAGVASVMGIGGDAIAVVSTIVLLGLMGMVALSDHRDRVVATVIGALVVQTLLRSPSFGFVGLPTLVAVVALTPMIWSAYGMAHRRERRAAAALLVATAGLVVVVATLAIFTLLGSRSGIDDGIDLAESGLTSLRVGDTPGANDRFTAAADRFQSSSDTLESWRTWGGRWVPIVGQHVQALRRVASAGVDLDESAATTASTADYRELTATAGQVDLGAVASLQEPVASAAATIQTALDSVAALQSPWLVAPVARELDHFGERLRDAGDQARIAADALAVAPDLLGVDGPRHYFVAFATPGESRNGGGFAGAFGLLTADAGRLEFTDAGTLNAPRAPSGDPYAFDPPADWDERYGSYSVDTFLGNLAASPDWPTDAGVVGQLFPQTSIGSPIDGALYLDPAAIAGLLELTGPVTIPELGMELASGNAERFLLQDQYVLIDGNNPERKELLADAARATFEALTSRRLPGIVEINKALGELVATGHLRLSVDDPDIEAFLDDVGLSGRWHVPEGSDHVSLRWANLASNKLDSFVHRDIEVLSIVDPATGSLTQKVTVTVHNEAPPLGLPTYVIGNQSGLPSGTSQNILALYDPHQLDSVSVDGTTIGWSVETEFGGPVYSVAVEVPPGESRTVVFDLHGTVPAWPYRLRVLSQPMAEPDRLTVRVQGSPGLGPEPQFAGSVRGTVDVGP
ncbi:MAG TPA: DUF4012 domain-containing protein [Acidimicrobiales bacterium]